MKTFVISPSELSYVCNHCSYIKKNYDIEPDSISAGVTQTLDSFEKKYFMGDVKKIDPNIKSGQVIDPLNISFYSKELKDNKNRAYRIKGKGDAIIKFDDNTSGIIDYKTSKFKDNKNKKYIVEFNKKILEYSPQLHAYSLLYSNLETDEKFLAKHSKAKDENKSESVKKTLKKIRSISINKTSLLGLVFIYPEKVKSSKKFIVDFDHKFEEVELDMKNFKNQLTKYLDILHNKKPPKPSDDCKTCNYFLRAGEIQNEK